MVATLRSAIPGRERWNVPALIGHRAEAAEVSSRLNASGELHSASASGVTGSVLVEFDPDLPRMRVRSLIVSTVAAVLEERPASRPAQPEMPCRHLYRLIRPHRATFFAATLFTILEKIFKVAVPLLALFAVNVATGGASAMLAAWGFGTALSQLVIIGGALVLSASVAWIAHDAHSTLWGNLGESVSGDLQGVARQSELDAIGGFWEHGSALVGFPIQLGAAGGAMRFVASGAAWIVLIPAAALGVVAILRPQRHIHQGERTLPRVLREWLRPRHLLAFGAIGAGALIAWLAGWITLGTAGVLFLLGELVLVPAMTIGDRLLAARDANEAARQLEVRNERKVLAISSGE